MEGLELKHKEIVEFCLANSDESVIKKYSRYFKKGYDAYGIDSNMIVTQKTKWLSSWEDEKRPHRACLGGYVPDGYRCSVNLYLPSVAAAGGDRRQTNGPNGRTVAIRH